MDCDDVNDWWSLQESHGLLTQDILCEDPGFLPEVCTCRFENVLCVYLAWPPPNKSWTAVCTELVNETVTHLEQGGVFDLATLQHSLYEELAILDEEYPKHHMQRLGDTLTVVRGPKGARAATAHRFLDFVEHMRKAGHCMANNTWLGVVGFAISCVDPRNVPTAFFSTIAWRNIKNNRGFFKYNAVDGASELLADRIDLLEAFEPPLPWNNPSDAKNHMRATSERHLPEFLIQHIPHLRYPHSDTDPLHMRRFTHAGHPRAESAYRELAAILQAAALSIADFCTDQHFCMRIIKCFCTYADDISTFLPYTESEGLLHPFISHKDSRISSVALPVACAYAADQGKSIDYLRRLLPAQLPPTLQLRADMTPTYVEITLKVLLELYESYPDAVAYHTSDACLKDLFNQLQAIKHFDDDGWVGEVTKSVLVYYTRVQIARARQSENACGTVLAMKVVRHSIIAAPCLKIIATNLEFMFNVAWAPLFSNNVSAARRNSFLKRNIESLAANNLKHNRLLQRKLAELV